MKYDISLKIAFLYCLLYRRIIFRTFYIFPITKMRQKNRPNLIWVFTDRKISVLCLLKFYRHECSVVLFVFYFSLFFSRKTIQIHNQ